jgi:hypothetical protein
MNAARAGLTIVASLVLTACTWPPNTVTDSPSVEHDGGAGQCEQGWVCGTCPDGSTWGYLNDPQYTNDPQLSKVIFDDAHPCG